MNLLQKTVINVKKFYHGNSSGIDKKTKLEWVRVIPDRLVNPDTSTFIEFMKTQPRISEYLFIMIINDIRIKQYATI